MSSILESLKNSYKNNKIKFFLTLLLSLVPLGGALYSLQNIVLNEHSILGIIFWLNMFFLLSSKLVSSINKLLGASK